MNAIYPSLTKALLLNAFFLYMGFAAVAQHHTSTNKEIRRDIETMLPEGEMTANVADSTNYTLSLSIANNGNKIWFYTYDDSSPAPSILDQTSIDLGKNAVILDGQELVYIGKITVIDKENSLQSKWKGHCWSSERPDGNDGKYHQFVLGKLEPSGQTYLHIQIKEIKQGEEKLSLDYPLLF
ncbi:hypothetical protein JHJ32_03160 [Parapedobacter sp. ISTM3]|uniref:hypothetical protein n=1 Tax=Parapedobacter sp. ISTM3 TaxID=2800130 RepID=UPI001908431D|nr:hypothetical protein [Parapedobacter sp. ISTM3]MBK1438976.1 hypothetical protein [Parapedobacter sp. ISTM3]